MSTSLPMLMPTQATGGGESTALPVNTAVTDSSEAFANVLSSHFQADGTTPVDPSMMPLTELDSSMLLPFLSVSSIDGQDLPLDLSQTTATDGNGLPLSPELMWSGMLVVNDSDATGPQLYQLSEDGQLVSQQIDPNMRAQINRAMNRFAPLSNAEMPELLNLTSQSDTKLPAGMSEQSFMLTATGVTPGSDVMAGQKFLTALPAALFSDSTDTFGDVDAGTGNQAFQAMSLAAVGEGNSDRLPQIAHLHMSGSPKNPAWAQGLGERVQWLVQQNIQGAEIRLNPPELGLLEVKVHLNGDHAAQIHFSSPNGTVREALEAAIPRLREMFAETGLNLGDVNVSHHSFAEQQNSGYEGNEGGGSSARMASSEVGLPEENRLQTRISSDGLVDMYV